MLGVCARGVFPGRLHPGGGLHLGGGLPRGWSASGGVWLGRGVLSRGLHPGGGLPRGVCMQGGPPRGGSTSGGSAPGGEGLHPGRSSYQGPASRGKVCIQRGVCIQGRSASGAGGLGRSPNQILRDTVNEREVHIPLECNLVII